MLGAEADTAPPGSTKPGLPHNDGLQRLVGAIRNAGAGHPTSPTREILVRLGDQWSTLLLSVLDTGCYRHAELHRVVNQLTRLIPTTDISQRMLTLRLRALERDGLVQRSVGEGKAPTVHYALTPLGHGLMGRAYPLLEWSVQHGEAIRAAQRAFDAQGDAPPIEGRRSHPR